MDELSHKIKEKGCLSELSKRISFLSLSTDEKPDFLEIICNEMTLRIDISDDNIRLIADKEIEIKRDAINSTTISCRNKKAVAT